MGRRDWRVGRCNFSGIPACKGIFDTWIFNFQTVGKGDPADLPGGVDVVPDAPGLIPQVVQPARRQAAVGTAQELTRRDPPLTPDVFGRLPEELT